MTKKVTVWDKLEGAKNIIIKEGNAGVYRDKAILKPGGKFELTLDPNATYRDYVLITLPDNTALPAFSSDDLVEWKEIMVKENKNVAEGVKKYYMACDPVPKSDPSSTPAPARWGNWLKRVFFSS